MRPFHEDGGRRGRREEDRDARMLPPSLRAAVCLSRTPQEEGFRCPLDKRYQAAPLNRNPSRLRRLGSVA